MPNVAPCLMFVGDQCGRAEEAIELYISAFEGSRIVALERFTAEDGAERGIKHARFEIAGQEIIAMDSPGPHPFTFTPAISLVVESENVDEIDAGWERLSDGATVLMALDAYDFSPRFGWLQDRYGVTWQLRLR